MCSLSWDPVNNKIASGSDDYSIKIWDRTSLALLRTLEGHSQDVTSVAWNHDGTMLVSGSRDETIKIWDQKLRCSVRTIIENIGRSYFSGVFSCLES
jgi:WD40 repeat protein